MPIVVKRVQGATVKELIPEGYAPLVRCPHCDRVVEDAGTGAAVWRPDENTTYIEVEFVHEACAAGYEEARNERLKTARMDEFLRRLVRNVGAAQAVG